MAFSLFHNLGQSEPNSRQRFQEGAHNLKQFLQQKHKKAASRESSNAVPGGAFSEGDGPLELEDDAEIVGRLRNPKAVSQILRYRSNSEDPYYVDVTLKAFNNEIRWFTTSIRSNDGIFPFISQVKRL